MSRSNHYRICESCTLGEPCWFHSRGSFAYSHKPIRFIEGRRNWERKQRYPKFSIKAWHNGPPRWWWQEKHAKVRQILRQMMLHEEDPALPSEKVLTNLWDWY